MPSNILRSQFTNPDGTVASISYEEADSFDNLASKKVTQVYGVCFLGEKIVIVCNENKKWSLPGGGLEAGETYEECLRREVKEETNSKVIDLLPVGFQEVVCDNETIYQIRYACTIEPFGEFVSDPDGDISEIKIIDSKEYKQYFNWGETGDAIISRAIELKTRLRRR